MLRPSAPAQLFSYWLIKRRHTRISCTWINCSTSMLNHLIGLFKASLFIFKTPVCTEGLLRGYMIRPASHPEGRQPQEGADRVTTQYSYRIAFVLIVKIHVSLESLSTNDFRPLSPQVSGKHTPSRLSVSYWYPSAVMYICLPRYTNGFASDVTHIQ